MFQRWMILTVLFGILVVPAATWSHAEGHSPVPPEAVDHGREVSREEVELVHKKLAALSEFLYAVDAEKSQKVWESLFEKYGYPRDRAAGMLGILNQSMEIIELRKEGGDVEKDLPKALKGYLKEAREDRRKRLYQELKAMSDQHQKSLVDWMDDWFKKLGGKNKQLEKKVHSHGDGKLHRH